MVVGCGKILKGIVAENPFGENDKFVGRARGMKRFLLLLGSRGVPLQSLALLRRQPSCVICRTGSTLFLVRAFQCLRASRELHGERVEKRECAR